MKTKMFESDWTIMDHAIDSAKAEYKDCPRMAQDETAVIKYSVSRWLWGEFQEIRRKSETAEEFEANMLEFMAKVTK